MNITTEPDALPAVDEIGERCPVCCESYSADYPKTANPRWAVHSFGSARSGNHKEACSCCVYRAIIEFAQRELKRAHELCDKPANVAAIFSYVNEAIDVLHEIVGCAR